MTIHQLLALTGLTANDEIPVWDAEASGEPTKKISAQNFAAAIKTLASLLGTGDVVNDLTSTATDKPLSANMGKTLNDTITQKTAWVEVANGDTLGSITFSARRKKEWLIVIRNTSGGTQFGSTLVPAVNIPSAIVVAYNGASTIVFSRSGSTLTYTPVSGFAVWAYER